MLDGLKYFADLLFCNLTLFLFSICIVLFLVGLFTGNPDHYRVGNLFLYAAIGSTIAGKIGDDLEKWNNKK